MNSTDKILWTDTETTGLIPGTHGICSVAVILDIGGEVVDRFEMEMKPTGCVVDNRALAVNGFTRGRIQKLEPWENILPDFIHRINKAMIKHLPEQKFTLGGQNVSFDDNHIMAWSKFCNAPEYWKILTDGEIDTMKISKQFKELGSHKLGDLCKAFGVKLENAHTAMADIDATRSLYYAMMKRIEMEKQGKLL